MSQALPYPAAPTQSDSRGVLAIPAFRKLWNTMVLSSFGDWLGLLATTALAQELAGGNYKKANFAIAGVFIVRLVPAVILGPIAGVIADRFDRRRLMIVCDFLRFAFCLSIPVVHTYFWLYTATVIIETITLFWSPAKDASVPNMVPKEKLESANQMTLLASYGSAPIAALMFSLLAGVSATISSFASKRYTSTSELALYIDAVTFLYTAWVVYRLQSIPRGPASASAVNDNVFKSLIEGFKFVAKSKVINGLIFGMLGAFFAAGAVIGLARTFVGDLNAGDAAYGILFAAVFTGLAIGIWAGPKIFAQFSRRRIFGAALTVSSFFLVILSSVSNMVLAIFLTVILGAFAGLSWVTGFTMLGLEVDDEVRGRIFAFVQSLIRISLVLVLAISPIIAAAIGRHTYAVSNFHLNYSGAAFTMFGAGIIGMAVGIISYRRMKDRPNISFFSDIRSALRGELSGNSEQNHKGIFIAFEGGEASGKSTQADLLKAHLESMGEKVVLSREPGGTPLGNQLRHILLDPATGNISPRSEALLYAADRANHVFALIKPALEHGDVVISDRYMDSSIAYQGAGRVLQPAEVARISRWATESLMPNLTIVMDLPADVGLSRLQSPDRLEQEPLMFHERVRREFLNLANVDPERYFIVDATLPKEEIAQLIADRVSLIPLLQAKRQKSVKE
jgi:dTMP kinase